jgi:cell division protein ZapA (FtsZ GTPase activity inhibitor)
MAALNIAHDLLRERRTPRAGASESAIDGDAARRRIQAMQSAIEQTLAGQENLF